MHAGEISNKFALLHQSESERVAVKNPVVGFDGRNDGEDEMKDSQGDQSRHGDESTNAEGDDHEEHQGQCVNGDRDVEVQRLLGMRSNQG